jgi:hypothetical protein
VASLQRTIHEQKEKIQSLERALSENAGAASSVAQGKTDAPAPAPGASPASEADIAKHNTLLDKLSKVEAKLAAAEGRASAAERALSGLAEESNRNNDDDFKYGFKDAKEMRQNAIPDAAYETTTVVSASSSGHKTPAGAKDEASDASPGQTTVISSSSSGNNAAPGQTTVVSASSSGDAQELSLGFVDTNGDGIIDEGEFKAFLDARKGQTMQYGASLVRVSGAVLHNKGVSKPYPGVNGDFERSVEICNRRAVYIHTSKPFAMWWSNNNGKLCWCVGKKDAVGTSFMVAYVESMGLGPEEAGKRPWTVYSYTSESWETQAGIEVLSLDRSEDVGHDLGNLLA